MPVSFDDISEYLKDTLSKGRYEHSLCVSDLAGKLGKRYGWDEDRARLTGLLHDCVKEWKPSQLLRYAKRHKLKIPLRDLIAKESPNHLHAYVGADFARRQGWIRNPADLKAIASHTFGSSHMTLQEKILYIADFSSVDRVYPKAKLIRKLALKNLDQGFLAAVTFKIKYQMKRMRFIHPVAVEMWNNAIAKKSLRGTK